MRGTGARPPRASVRMRRRGISARSTSRCLEPWSPAHINTFKQDFDAGAMLMLPRTPRAVHKFTNSIL